jgi:hypothetical protein
MHNFYTIRVAKSVHNKRAFTSGEARNLQVGGHVTIFEFLGGHKLKNLKICLSICTYVRDFRNFWVGLCPPGPYSGFATGFHYRRVFTITKFTINGSDCMCFRAFFLVNKTKYKEKIF